MRRIFAWIRQRMRFSISALVAFILALNLVVYMNWLAKEPYVSSVFCRESPTHDFGEEYTRVTNYRLGWPVKSTGQPRQIQIYHFRGGGT
jgi:hypothetical protein